MAAFSPGQLSQLAKSAAVESGFQLCGVASLIREMSELAYFPAWISAGRAGEMEYLKARDEKGEFKRASPANAAPWAKSVVVCALNYDTAQPYSTAVAGGKRRGWIARYAWSRQDYHKVVLKKLRCVEAALAEAANNQIITRSYVDTGPHIERIYAKYAGVGWIGKNTCILHEQQGSWIFLGVILCSFELEPDLPAPDRCGSCTRCIEACPTAAIPEPYRLDATRCISYLTIEKRGAIPEALRPLMGNHVFGCDICQDVCPWNDPSRPEIQRTPFGTAPELSPRPELVNPALDWLAAMTADDFQRVFRGSPVKRARYSGLRRNVSVAMGNSGDQSFLPQLERMSNDADPLVAEHARWAIERLRAKRG